MRVLKRNTVMVLIAALLVVGASIGLTAAYFSDYEDQLGVAKLNLSGETTIEEEVTDTEKTIVIKNTGVEGQSANVVVRIQIFGPDGMTIPEGSIGSGWVKGGDYYYYNKVLAPGEETTSITASVKDLPVDVDLSDFDIIVVQESATAVYDENNVVKCPAGWSAGDFPKIKAQ